MFCKGKNGARRKITYFDVLKDFVFMADKGFDYEYIRQISRFIDLFSGRNSKPKRLIFFKHWRHNIPLRKVSTTFFHETN